MTAPLLQWRNSGRRPRLWGMDARLPAALFAWVLVPRLWVFLLAVGAVGFLAGADLYGYRPGAALRALRRLLAGPARALGRPAIRRAVDCGALTLAAALAVSPAPVAAEDSPALLERLRSNGAELVPLEPRLGLPAWHVRTEDSAGYVLYALPDGRGWVAGLLYDPGGNLLTLGQLEGMPDSSAGPVAARESPRESADPAPERLAPAAEAPAEAPLTADMLLARTEALEGFRLGARDAPLTLHVFADPLCPHSHALVTALGREAAHGRLQANILPVAAFGEQSFARAVQIAGARHPASAWAAPDRAGVAETETGIRRVAEATAVYDAWAAGAVPFTVFRAAGGEARVSLGAVAPADLLREAGQ